MSKCISFTPRQAEHRSFRPQGVPAVYGTGFFQKPQLLYQSFPLLSMPAVMFFSQSLPHMTEILVNHKEIFLTSKQFCNILLMTFGEERETHAL